MNLYAISDLHIGYPANLQALEALPAHPGDWLILGGDIGETEAHLEKAFGVLLQRFARLLWVPGNHELWSVHDNDLRGEAKYQQLVSVCRAHGVLTPEDPYVLWEGEGGPHWLVPLFLLYDYSFRPDGMPESQAVAWAMEENLLCADERFLYPDPHPSRQAWCRARLAYSEARLSALDSTYPRVLINHFPLRRDLCRLFRIPRFSIWCGTRQTEDWHTRHRAAVVVSGHLHMRSTDHRDGVRFEEVSLGYPRHWRAERGVEGYLRLILPGPTVPGPSWSGPDWHF